MQLVSRLALALSLGVFAGCSSNHDNGNGGDAGSGSAVDAPGPACDYTEAADATNGATPEASNVTIGAQTRTLCGQVDGGHYDTTSKTVDVDRYSVTVGATAELIVQFADTQPGGLTDFQVEIFDTAADPTLLSAGDYDGSLSDHGAYLAELPAGTFDIVVTATAAADVGAAIPYKVRLVADHPTTRCPDLTGMAADYAEAHDGAGNTGNDVLLVDTTKNPSFTLTPATTDAAEPTALTIDPAAMVHISGSSAAVAAGTDKYLDRDTYEIATGAATNELSIRLAWPGSTADLDYAVFADGSLTPNVLAMLTATSGGEFATFAVKPGASYQVWIGAYLGSTGTPIAYDAAVCGATFAP